MDSRQSVDGRCVVEYNSAATWISHPGLCGERHGACHLGTTAASGHVKISAPGHMLLEF